MVETHGSQCGFCTPGFVMSLFGLYKNARRPTRARGRRRDLGQPVPLHRLPADPRGRAAHARPAAPADWRGPGVAGDGSRIVERERDARSPNSSRRSPSARSTTRSHGQRWIAPDTEDALAAACAAHPDAVLVAGATDVGLWITKQHRDAADDDRHARRRATWHASSATTRMLEIGAGASLADAFAALDDDYPELHEAWVRFASVPIRHSGTLGGNVANGSPIGDSMPALIALGASVVLRRGNERREMPLEDFYLGVPEDRAPAGRVRDARARAAASPMR